MKLARALALLPLALAACSPLRSTPDAASPPPSNLAAVAAPSSAVTAPVTVVVPAPPTSARAPQEPGARSAKRCATARACALYVARAFEARDMDAIAAVAHPSKGVRFTPYAYVDTSADVVLRASALPDELRSRTPRTWGSFDGNGDPIRMTFASYVGRFVANAAFSAATDVGENRSISGGNTTDNAREAYPSADIVELYLPPSSESTMDWSALRLVFESVDGAPYLVGVVHSEWTI